MIRYENNCVGCPQGCISCGRKHEEVYICDDCKNDYAKYLLDGDELCEKCILKRAEDEYTVDICERCECAIEADDFSYYGLCKSCFLRSHKLF